MADGSAALAAAGYGLQQANNVLGAASGFLGTHLQRSWEEKQSIAQQQWNEKMLDKVNEFNLDMWNRTNAYNTPSEQYARLRDAHLNPLFYGLDGTGNAGALESGSPLGYTRPTGVSNPFSVLSQSMLSNQASVGTAAEQAARISNIQADTAKKSQETLTEVKRRDQMSADIDRLKATVDNIAANTDLTEAQRANLDKVTSWIDRLNEANIGYYESMTKLNASQKKRIDALLPGEVEIQNFTLSDFMKKWEQIDAEIAKLAKETGLLEKDIENYALNHMTNGLMGSGASFQNIYRFVLEGIKNKFSK